MTLERLAPRLAVAVPLVVTTVYAGASMGYYDAPELAAAAQGVGVTHPPGHPLWVVLASIATLLPVATVPLRIALLNGLCLAVIARIVYGVAHDLAHGVLDHPSLRARADRVLTPLAALSVSTATTVGIAVARQATRAEVYALAGMLSVGVLGLACATRRSTSYRARLSVLLVALGGANHHFIALTAAPLAVATMVEHLRAIDAAARRRAALSWALFGAIGLLPYVLLLLRNDAGASLVRVRTIGDLVWTVSARAFQRNMAGGVPGSFGEHMLGVLDWIGASLTPIGIVAALGGTFLLLRASASGDIRSQVLRLFALATVVCGARAMLGFVASNPDAAGYLMAGIAAIACLAVGFPVAAWKAIRLSPASSEGGPTRGARVALTLALVAAPLLTPLYLLITTWRDTVGDRAYVPESAADVTLAPLPPHAVVLAYSPESVFRLRYAQRVEGERPDVTVVPVPFLPYPGMNNTLLSRDAALLPIIRDYLAHGDARLEQLAALASRRPVRVEIDPHNVLAMVQFLVPRGMLAELRSEPSTLASVRGIAAAHFAAIDSLAAAIVEERGGADAKTAELVLWRNYNDALFFAARGARTEALASTRRALLYAPEALELRGLAAALSVPGEGPIDVRAYIVRAHRGE